MDVHKQRNENKEVLYIANTLERKELVHRWKTINFNRLVRTTEDYLSEFNWVYHGLFVLQEIQLLKDLQILCNLQV